MDILKSLVLLAGAGLGDGSEVSEVSLTYTILDKYSMDYTPIAESRDFISINHLVYKNEESRNVLKESARIGRGIIKDIEDINYSDYHVLIIPGGRGLMENYKDSKLVKELLEDFYNSGKAIVTMCAGLGFLREILGINIIVDMERLNIEDSYYDRTNNIYYTAAFKGGSNLYKIYKGIDNMIGKLRENQIEA